LLLCVVCLPFLCYCLHFFGLIFPQV
jgi:hypothetical protein